MSFPEFTPGNIPLPLVSVAAALLMFAGIVCFVWALVSDPKSWVRVGWLRYLSYLEAELRALFLSAKPARIAIAQAALLIVIGVIGVLGFRFWYVALALVLLGPRLVLRRMRKRRSQALDAQIEPFATALANALRTTPNIGSALDIVGPLLTSPMKEELDLVLKEMRVGSTVEKALGAMAARVQCVELEAVLAGVLIGREVGGNVVQNLEETASALREMIRLSGLVRTKTASGRTQLTVLALAPGVVVIGFEVTRPGYFEPLTNTATGWILCAVTVVLWVIGVVLGRKLAEVDI